MSKEWTEKTGETFKATTSPEMRSHCQRKGRVDKDGKKIYMTQQNHKKECDVNEIIRKYDRKGLITHISRFEAKFGDLRGVDFKNAMDTVCEAQRHFQELPSEIRKRFQNSPEKLLEFMEDGNNRDEAIKLGLIDSRWTVSSDGLGEHVLEGENVVETVPPVVNE